MAVGPSRSRRALRPRLPGRTVRTRLSFVYGALFLLSGAVLLVITGVLWGRATSGPLQISAKVPGQIISLARPGPAGIVRSGKPPALNRISGGREDLPAPLATRGQVRQVTNLLDRIAAQQHVADLHQLLLYSGIALAIMAMLSIALGWLTAGRMLRPLRTITSAARDLSATNLHERLSLEGPADELKELGDTFDQLLARLEQSFQAQRQFVANASHELRTPLATMRAALEVTLAKPRFNREQLATLGQRMSHELDRMDQLLESFLALARAQHGSGEDEAAVSLDHLAASVLSQQAVRIAERELQVGVELGPAAFVSGNATLLSRMVHNVIDNAVGHNEQGGWIRVRTGVEGDLASLVVENGGPVLDEGAVKDLAHPFRRLGAERTGSESGVGLGLSIVAAIAEAHGGRLVLHALPGGGIQVRIELPLSERALAGAPA
ncbi:MAG: hypothetical protein JWM85_2168 [Acidimicrobiaceae bacterium]|nr:hypothetical protein [Acidimicrobiaceae bacterium]